MKKRAPILILALLLVLTIPAYAATTRNIINVPGLSYNGTVANCSAIIIGGAKSSIEAEISLWDGSRCVAAWSEEATYKLEFKDTATVTRGRTYTLKVDATIDGTSQPTASVSAKCP